MLKHLAVCVHGEDLSDCYGDFETSWEIAKHWNMDAGFWLAVYRNKIAETATPEQQVAAQVMLAKLLRTGFSLIMYRDKNWFDAPIVRSTVLKISSGKEVEIQGWGFYCLDERFQNVQ